MSKLVRDFTIYFWRFICSIMNIRKIFRMKEPVSQKFLIKKEEINRVENELVESFLIIEKNQKQPLAEIFRMQEPVSKALLNKKEETYEYKEILQEKEILAKNNLAKIEDLEAEIAELKQENRSLKFKLTASSLDDNGFQEMMLNYEEFFNKIWNERQELVDNNNVKEIYVENLERSYNELLEKFEKAKEIIYGLKTNQDLLKEELQEYKTIVEELEKRYEILKIHSETRIDEANKELGNKEKENLHEVATLKTKIVQRQAKINELENILKKESKSSIYAPLRNQIRSK